MNRLHGSDNAPTRVPASAKANKANAIANAMNPAAPKVMNC
jgi:hypothetical protein